jgi:MFS family permease
MAPNMQWQPVFQNFFQDTALFGWLWVVMTLAVMGGNSLVPWLRKTLPHEKWVFVLALSALGIGIMMVPQTQVFVITAFFFLLHEVGRGILRPNMESYLNGVIPSHLRATLLSFHSMTSKGGAALGLLVSGWLAKSFSIPLTWGLFGALILLLIPIALKLKGKEEV